MKVDRGQRKSKKPDLLMIGFEQGYLITARVRVNSWDMKSQREMENEHTSPVSLPAPPMISHVWRGMMRNKLRPPRQRERRGKKERRDESWLVFALDT